MRKLITITIFIFGLTNCNPKLYYKSIAENDIKTHFEKPIDTLKNKRISRKWEEMQPEYKEKIRSQILEKRKDIESDSADVTRIYYFGKKENVGLKINDKFLKPTSSKAEYHSESIYGDSIFKIQLGEIPRYSNVRIAQLFLNGLKRTTEFKIDPKYSLIEIKVEHLRSATEILNREKAITKNSKKIKKSGKLPKAPDTIEVLNEEEVLILHKVPKRKHSW